MLHKLVVLCSLSALLLGGGAYAQHRTIDLADYDDDLMHDVDRALKSFEPDVTAKNAENALDDAGVIADGFKYSEGYFSKKADAGDAVKIAQEGRTLIANIVKAIDDKDFPQAITLSRQVPNTCKSCHDIYKPRNK